MPINDRQPRPVIYQVGNEQVIPLPPEVVWMQRPTVTGCPPGLEYLTQIDHLLAKPQTFTCHDTHCCEHYHCDRNRQFTIHIYDNASREVIQLKRLNRCRCPIRGRNKMTVESPPGVTIGYVTPLVCCCTVHYEIMDENKTTVLQIDGPNKCRYYCPGEDIPYKILSASGNNEVGKLTIHLALKCCTDTDNLEIKFPVDLDVKMKAVALGALILIDID